jgi:hypothetical protein
MYSTQGNYGTLAANYPRMPNLDETTNAAADYNIDRPLQSPFPRPSAHVHPASYGFNPPHDAKHLQQRGHDTLEYHQHYGDTTPSHFEHGHPPTPPRQEDEVQLLQRWHPQYQYQDNASTPATHHDCASPFYAPQSRLSYASDQYYSNSNNQSATQLYSDANHINQQLSTYAQSTQYEQSHGYLAQYATTPVEADLGTDPRPHHDYASTPSFNSHVKPLSFNALPDQQPPIQQWPTHALGQASRQPTPPYQRARSFSDAIAPRPSSGYNGVTPPDQRLLEKKEAHQLMTGYARQNKQSVGDSLYIPGSVKRKLASESASSALPTLPPFLRHSPVNESQPSQAYFGQPSRYSQPYPNTDLPYPYDSHGLALGPHRMIPHVPPSAFQQSRTFVPDGIPRLLPITLEGQNFVQNYPVGAASTQKPGRKRWPAREPTRRKIPAPKAKQPPTVKAKPKPPLPTDWDAIPQEITSAYENYKWSVTHYEVDSGDTYGFAQSWLEDLFATNLLPDDYRWHSHSTQGFIKDGTRNSFVALHNADNPFEYDCPSSSTTSIGVYGHDWHEHNTIHWKTFAPDIRWLLHYCELGAGTIHVKQKWTFNMPRASERRFHRAYWLAATRKRMRGLLNRGPSNDVPHDVVEMDGDFDFTEEDVGNEWDNTFEEAKEAWRIVQEEIEDMEDVGSGGYEHVVTGSSERE